MTALNKIILKTAVSGLVWTAVLFSYGFGIFAFSFPRVMVDFMDVVGNTRLSAMYMERIYRRNPTPENLYFALDKFIIAQNNSKIIEFGKKLFDLEDENPTIFNSIIDQINEFKKESAADFPLILMIINEDNRLRTAYIQARLARGAAGDKARATEILERVIDVDTLAPRDFLRPSSAIFAFGADAPPALRKIFEEYLDLFEAQFALLGSTQIDPVAQLFNDTARTQYTNFFGGFLL